MPARHAARWLLLIVAGLTGCAGSLAPDRLALLGPFEGRYREIGYEAYYAVQLALNSDANTRLTLLAIDDGGSVTSAVERAVALTEDHTVRAVLLIGPYAVDEAVQRELEAIPALIIGYWGVSAVTHNVQLIAPDGISQRSTAANARDLFVALASVAPFTGSEMLALPQFAALRADTRDIELLSSAPLPNRDFRERYAALSAFAPQPGLIAVLTHESTQSVIQRLATGSDAALSWPDNLSQDGLHYRFSKDGQIIPTSGS